MVRLEPHDCTILWMFPSFPLLNTVKKKCMLIQCLPALPPAVSQSPIQNLHLEAWCAERMSAAVSWAVQAHAVTYSPYTHKTSASALTHHLSPVISHRAASSDSTSEGPVIGVVVMQGNCRNSVCVCTPGYSGTYCEVPPACGVILDVNGNCCNHGVVSAAGVCCGSVRVCKPCSLL